MVLAVCLGTVASLGAASTNSSDPAETSFPSDTKLPAQAEAKDLLAAVCPGRVALAGSVECRLPCPKYTSFAGEDMTWSFDGITQGHFLSPTSDDAAVSITGCEPHSENFGGTALVTRRSGRWSMLWYKAGVETSRCHKVPLKDRREILVCIGEYGSQGDVVTALYIEDLRAPKPALMAGTAEFFVAYDNTLTCGAMGNETFPLIRSHIDRVAFGDLATSHPPAISVSASFGKKPTTPANVQACTAKRDGSLPETRLHQIEFFFDGQNYSPTPSSIEAARLFGRQNTSQ